MSTAASTGNNATPQFFFKYPFMERLSAEDVINLVRKEVTITRDVERVLRGILGCLSIEVPRTWEQILNDYGATLPAQPAVTAPPPPPPPPARPPSTTDKSESSSKNKVKVYGSFFGGPKNLLDSFYCPDNHKDHPLSGSKAKEKDNPKVDDEAESGENPPLLGSESTTPYGESTSSTSTAAKEKSNAVKDKKHFCVVKTEAGHQKATSSTGIRQHSGNTAMNANISKLSGRSSLNTKCEERKTVDSTIRKKRQASKLSIVENASSLSTQDSSTFIDECFSQQTVTADMTDLTVNAGTQNSQTTVSPDKDYAISPTPSPASPSKRARVEDQDEEERPCKKLKAKVE